MSNGVQSVADGFRNKNQNPGNSPNAPGPGEPTPVASSPAIRTAPPGILAQEANPTLHHPASPPTQETAAKKSKTQKGAERKSSSTRVGGILDKLNPNPSSKVGTRPDLDLSKRLIADDTNDERKATLLTQAPQGPNRNNEVIATLVEKHLAAEKAGDQEASDLYFAMFKSLMSTKSLAQPAPTPLATPTEDSNLKLRSKKPVNPNTYAKYAPIPKYHKEDDNQSDGESVVGNIQFSVEAVPRHDAMGFTPYFDKNIRELKGPIPLTIFNKAWKNRAILYYAEKRSKFEDLSSDFNRYTGYPYPLEWTQSFSDWTSNHQNFYNTLKVEYNFKRMANWLLAHKANADAILAEDGFVVALRYNIQHDLLVSDQ
ncbi:hypothetical protein PtA15_9A251 [Puccinia triticina]|uniref:NOT2/NOT3/NOT5 C-terminal domain-containing protein n=1 Tax=Puccinia triticina TaxID=208348 RepID=A0ABY7CSA4_9BASI|nr:uncharacterized protein PtA15_9A251 [Puccinia triticina]WAQ88126.1 hypothetical protein PtA15_9A251 [Puccinia triticina]